MSGHPVGHGGDGPPCTLDEPHGMGSGRVGEGPELVEVTPGTERRPGPVEMHLAEGIVHCHQPEGIGERVAHGGVERVADMRPGECDLQAIALAGDIDGWPDLWGTRPDGTAGPPAGELRPGLERRVDGRLQQQAVVERPRLAPAENLGQRHSGQRLGGHGGHHRLDRRGLPGQDHVAGTCHWVRLGMSERCQASYHEWEASAGRLDLTSGLDIAPLLGADLVRRVIKVQQQQPGPRRTGLTDAVETAGLTQDVEIIEGYRVRRHDGKGVFKVSGGDHCRTMALQHDPERRHLAAEPASEVAVWAASGAMALTGRPGEPPLGPPAGLVPKLQRITALIDERSSELGQPVRIDPIALLGERAAQAGLVRQGSTSCGGASRLMATRDGWLAVSLARDEDVELVPAWLQRDVPAPDVWSVVVDAALGAKTDELVEQAVLLGLPVAALPSAPVPPLLTPPPLAPLPVGAVPIHLVANRHAADHDMAGLKVVDLSSLWAGPLCGSLLAEAGADVVKVESIHRPDGARRGPGAFFDLLNAGKRSVALDLRTPSGKATLTTLITQADVVIEGSRPRALEQLGIEAHKILRNGGRGPRVWASITGHGRHGGDRDRVAFGDDAAVAGGLVSWDEQGPCFCADAIADPCAGLVAAAAALDALHVGGTWLLDIRMNAVAASLAGPTLTGATPRAAAPQARAPRGLAPALGADNDAVLARLEQAR